jgi:malate synthase
MSGPEQIARQRDDVQVCAADLLDVPATPVITEQGIRTNLSVGVQYLESWLRGSGCVPINNLMEDAATAEISRAQLWQWAHHNAQTDDGRAVTRDGLAQLLEDELRRLRERAGDEAFAAGRYDDARRLFRRMIDSPEIPEFLTTAAYELL